MVPRAVLVFDVAFENIREDLLPDMRVQFAFLSRCRHALGEALEREEGRRVPSREEKVGRHVGSVNLPVDDGQFPGLAGVWQ
jgi:hypothetical protein